MWVFRTEDNTQSFGNCFPSLTKEWISSIIDLQVTVICFIPTHALSYQIGGDLWVYEKPSKDSVSVLVFTKLFISESTL